MYIHMSRLGYMFSHLYVRHHKLCVWAELRLT